VHFLVRDTRRFGIADDAMYAFATRAAIGGIVGARLVYVLNHWSAYGSVVDWFKVWEGGLSLLGAIAGAVIATAVEVRRRRMLVTPLMDLAAAWLPLGIAIGRVGDIVIADHLGATTSRPYGFRCPSVVDVGRTVGSPCPPGATVHLTAAYDLLVAALVAAVLIVLRRVALRRGDRSLLFAVLYGAGRFGFDFLREDTRRLGLTGSQWTASVLVVLGLVALVVRHSGSSIHERVTVAPRRDELPDGPPDEAVAHVP